MQTIGELILIAGIVGLGFIVSANYAACNGQVQGCTKDMSPQCLLWFSTLSRPNCI